MRSSVKRPDHDFPGGTVTRHAPRNTRPEGSLGNGREIRYWTCTKAGPQRYMVGPLSTDEALP